MLQADLVVRGKPEGAQTAAGDHVHHGRVVLNRDHASAEQDMVVGAQAQQVARLVRAVVRPAVVQIPVTWNVRKNLAEIVTVRMTIVSVCPN